MHTSNESQLEGNWPDSEELLTPEQVAKLLNMSPRWVRDHATRRSPRIRAVNLGSRMRFRPRDVEEFIRERSRGEGSPYSRIPLGRIDQDFKRSIEAEA
jgi:excisionase family DNA binding protein